MPRYCERKPVPSIASAAVEHAKGNTGGITTEMPAQVRLCDGVARPAPRRILVLFPGGKMRAERVLCGRRQWCHRSSAGYGFALAGAPKGRMADCDIGVMRSRCDPFILYIRDEAAIVLGLAKYSLLLEDRL
jgi:hypothetical protein